MNKEMTSPPLGSPKAGTLAILLFAVVMALNFMEGVDGHLLPLAARTIAHDWGVPLSGFGAAMAAGFGGAAIGAPIGGLLGDRIGRKRTTMIGATIFSVTTSIIPFCESPDQLILARLVAGIGIGGSFPPSLALLIECVPSKIKGVALSSALVFQSLGIAAAGIMAGVIIPAYGWTALFLCAGALSIAATVSAGLVLPESPSFLKKRPNRQSEAERVIARYRIATEESVGGGVASTARFGMRSLRPALRLFASMFLTFFVISVAMSWLPSFLQERGFTLIVASTTTTVWITSAMGGTMLGGVGVMRYGAWKAALGFICLAIIALFFTGGLAFMTDIRGGAGLMALYVMLGICGAMMSAVMASLFAYGVDLFPVDQRSSGIGVLQMFGKAGGFAGAYGGVVALQLDRIGSFFLTLSLGVIVIAVMVLSDYFLVRKRQIADAG